MSASSAEELLAQQILDDRLPAPEREFRFHPERRWRMDFAWPDMRLGLEVDGWGRHQRYVGFLKDCEKYSSAAALGWRVLRVVPAQVRSGEAIDWLRQAMRTV